jgi:hypothetical protein
MKYIDTALLNLQSVTDNLSDLGYITFSYHVKFLCDEFKI